MGVKWDHIVILICISLTISGSESLFICLLVICKYTCMCMYICIFFFWKMSIQILFPFLIGLFVFLLLSHKSVFVCLYSGYKSLIRYVICKYVLPFPNGLSFHFPDSSQFSILIFQQIWLPSPSYTFFTWFPEYHILLNFFLTLLYSSPVSFAAYF